jgi:hypothetical protein
LADDRPDICDGRRRRCRLPWPRQGLRRQYDRKHRHHRHGFGRELGPTSIRPADRFGRLQRRGCGCRVGSARSRTPVDLAGVSHSGGFQPHTHDSKWQLSPMQKNVFATAMAFEMGLQACVARRLAVRDMTTVVVTSTLVSFAGESLVGRPKGRVWNRRLAAVTAILAGALTGAALQHVHLGLAMAAASCLTIGMTVTGHLRWNGRSSGAQTD